MFRQATTLILAVTLVHGSSQFDGPMQQLNSMQDSLRRMQTLDSLLPHLQAPTVATACLAACPGAAQVATRLMAAMAPHMAEMALPLAAAALETPATAAAMTLAQKQAKIQELMPLFQVLATVTSADMCANQADYVCLAGAASKCGSPAPAGGGLVNLMSIQAAVDRAQNNAPLMDCMCNKCQDALKTQATMAATMLSAQSAAFTKYTTMAAPLTQAAAAAEAPAIWTTLLEGLCPLMGMKRCFDANPTQCGTMLAKENMHNMSSSDVAPKCTAAGIKAMLSPAVSQKITLMGLNFSKVVADPARKNEVMTLVKNAFLAILPGFVPSDMLVSLTQGSVVATVEVTPMPGLSTASLLAFVKGDPAATATSIATSVQNMSSVTSMLKDGVTQNQISATAAAPSTKSSSTTAAPAATAAPVETTSSAHATAVFKILMAISAQGMILATM